MDDRSPALQIMSMLFGLLVWAAHFLFVYVFAALACARGFASASLFGFGIVPATIVGSTAIAVLAVALHAALRLREESHASRLPFMNDLGVWVDALGILAMLMTGATVIVPVCS